jgi:Uma2 family endonuclease
MVQLQPAPQSAEISYPDRDGNPMSDNTKQFRWIVTIKENLECLFADRPNVFVAGDLLWYPIEGDNKTRVAPDAMVVVGRPKGDRGSYKQWEEANIAPQVVFEILSPGNTKAEMSRKLLWYDRFGVEEYYIYDPDRHEFQGYLRQDGFLAEITAIDAWVSPRLNIRFEFTAVDFQIFYPNGDRFVTQTEMLARAETAEQRAETAEQRAAVLAAKLRELGIDPNQL